MPSVLAKKVSRKSGPGGGNTFEEHRPNNASICRSARRTVAVLAMIFGRITCSPCFLEDRLSMAVS